MVTMERRARVVARTASIAMLVVSGCAAGAVREARVGALARYPDAAHIAVEAPAAGSPASDPLRAGLGAKLVTGAGHALGPVGLADYPGAPGQHLTLRLAVLTAK